jgi:hypothetical protein
MDAVSRIPAPVNEPVRQYQPGSHERAVLESKIKELAGQRAELTMTIGGRQQMPDGEKIDVIQPHNRRGVLGQLGNATDVDVASAIYAAKQAAPGWRALSFEDRAAVFLRAADLLAGPWRATLNAATMLGQSKSPYQAEIDAACEMIDFWRYNVTFARQSSRNRRQGRGTGWITGRSRASCWPSRRSTSARSPGTCRPPRRCSATWWCGSRRRPSSSRRTTRCACSRRLACRRG